MTGKVAGDQRSHESMGPAEYLYEEGKDQGRKANSMRPGTRKGEAVEERYSFGIGKSSFP
jgi:hypothetical protein